MTTNGSGLVCENCGRKSAHIRPVSRSYGKGANLLVIEQVPVVSCANCGSSYLTAATLREIARIKRRRRDLKKRNVVVADFVNTTG